MHPMIKFWIPLAVIGAILLAYVMGHCAGSNDTERNAKDARANIVIARLAAEIFQQESTFAHQQDSTARVIIRLRNRRIPVDTLRLTVTDTVVLDQLDVRDSIIVALDSAVEQAQRTALFWQRATVTYRDSVIPSLQRARDDWKRQASESHMVTDLSGGALVGYGIAEKNEVVVVTGAGLVVLPRVFDGVRRLLHF